MFLFLSYAGIDNGSSAVQSSKPQIQLRQQLIQIETQSLLRLMVMTFEIEQCMI